MNTTTTYLAPRFQHDCERCTYLGHHEDCDLYFCGDQNHHSVIARWADNGPDYASGIEGSYIQAGPLYVARQRAQQEGLVNYDLKMAAFYLNPKTTTELREEFKGHLAQSEVGKAMTLMLSDANEGISKVKNFMATRWAALLERHPQQDSYEVYDWLLSEMDRYQIAATTVGYPNDRWPWVQAVGGFRAIHPKA